MRVCSRIASSSKLPRRAAARQYSQATICRLSEPTQEGPKVPFTKSWPTASALITGDAVQTHGTQRVNQDQPAGGSSINGNVARGADVAESPGDGDGNTSNVFVRTSRVSTLPLSPLMEAAQLASRAKNHLAKGKERRGSARTPFQQALANNIYGMLNHP